MGKKKKGYRKKKGWKYYADMGVKSAALMLPEIGATLHHVKAGYWEQWPRTWIQNRTGLDITGQAPWDPMRAVMWNGASVGLLMAWKMAKKMAR